MEAVAERSTTFDNYIVHYNAFRSDMIPAEVAQRHNIIRSNHRAIVNITVLRRSKDGSTQPIPARVTGTATNLSSQLSTLHFFQVREQEAIYYLDQFRIGDNETLRFQIQVEPEQPYAEPSTVGNIHFTQRFYTTE